MSDMLDDAERYKRLFIDPVVEAMSSEMKAHLAPLAEAQKYMAETQDRHETRITELEGSQKKALLGWGVYATGLSIVVSTLWERIKSKMGWS